MINLLIGPPGGGKSYEAVVYHILPALKNGRKVITNLPLDLERLSLLDAAYPELVQKVDNRRGVLPQDSRSAMFSRFGGRAVEPEEGIIRAFQTMTDYADPWRHPESGAGPLYVIDECHMALPRGNTLIEVEEWFSLHRHELADVLLITQSYGKVSKSIIDLVQVCYRVKKGTAFGIATKYIRKVQDGVRGEVVNTNIRQYEKRYFGLYKSHTRTDSAGAELAAEDITPIWKRWPFIGAAILIPGSIAMFVGSGSPNILKPKVKPPESTAVALSAPGPAPSLPQAQKVAPTAQEAKPKADEPPAHPYAGRTLHIIGSLHARGQIRYVFAVAQNGVMVMDATTTDMETLGYTIVPATDCAAKVGFGKWQNWVICDRPQVAVTPTVEGVSSGSRTDSKAQI